MTQFDSADVVNCAHLAHDEDKERHLCLLRVGATSDVSPGLLRWFMYRSSADSVSSSDFPSPTYCSQGISRGTHTHRHTHKQRHKTHTASYSKKTHTLKKKWAFRFLSLCVWLCDYSLFCNINEVCIPVCVFVRVWVWVCVCARWDGLQAALFSLLCFVK